MITGIFAPIPTPFVDQEISFDKFRDNLQKWGRSDLHGIVVLGSNGECVYLGNEEKIKLIAYARENFPRIKQVIAGTGCETTAETINLTKAAAEAGADAGLVITPSYYKGSMTDDALKKHFETVAEVSPIPIMLYNMPRNTGINMSAKLVAEMSRHPNIVGVKDSSGNIVQITEIVANTEQSFAVFAGSGSFLLASLAVGAAGGTLAVANVIPDECVKIFDDFNAGRLEEAKREQYRILPVNAAVTSKYGVPGLKYALDLVGYFGGETRKPTLPLNEAQQADVKKILKAAKVPLA